MAQNVAVPDDVHATLKERAKKEGMKMTAIVERALREWLARRKKAAMSTEQSLNLRRQRSLPRL